MSKKPQILIRIEEEIRLTEQEQQRLEIELQACSEKLDTLQGLLEVRE